MTRPERESIRIECYGPEHRKVWNEFLAGAKNGVLLFHRDYMDYHADRFSDASLIAYRRDRPIAVLPANRDGDLLVSHGGLTFGGFVTNAAMRTPTMLRVFEELIGHLRQEGVRRLTYKAVPHIYHLLPAEEDLYALSRQGARLVRRDVSSAVRLQARPRASKGRRWALARARRQRLELRASDDYRTFMALVEARLSSRYGLAPTHTADELRLLAARFPRSIELVGVFRGEEMLAGAVVYVGARVAHAQYIGASDEGREIGATDLLLEHLIAERYPGCEWFDFGISTEQEGRYLNVPLIENKEGFGARAVVHDFYALEIPS